VIYLRHFALSNQWQCECECAEGCYRISRDLFLTDNENDLIQNSKGPYTEEFIMNNNLGLILCPTHAVKITENSLENMVHARQKNLNPNSEEFSPPDGTIIYINHITALQLQTFAKDEMKEAIATKIRTHAANCLPCKGNLKTIEDDLKMNIAIQSPGTG